MLPKISLPDLWIAVETITSMKAGTEIGGGKLCPDLELQQLSFSGPPFPALASQTCIWLTGSANPLKAGMPFVLKFPPVGFPLAAPEIHILTQVQSTGISSPDHKRC